MSFTIPYLFGKEPLDELDRKILLVISGHGRNGQSFNRLVSETKQFASRSTFALRTKRLENLHYLERFPDTKNKQVRRIRGMPLILLLMRIVTRMREQCTEVERSIRREIAPERKGQNPEEELGRLREFLEQANVRIKNIYSLVVTYAILFGEAAAGDLILPMLMDDFRTLNSELMRLLSSNPKLTRALATEKLASISHDSLKEDFKYAFGIEISQALPKFSKHFEKLAGRKPRTSGRAGRRRCE